VAWSFERIAAEWLQDAAVTLSPARLMRLFEIVEAAFGREWMEGRRGPSAATGSYPTMRIVNAGQLIEAVADLPGGNELLERLKADEPGSVAESLVVAAIRWSDPAINLTLSPPVRVGQRDRRPDVLAERDAERVYVEVSTPQRTDEYQAVQARIQALADRALVATPFGNVSEIYLHREPSDQEMASLVEMIGRMCAVGGERLVAGDVANVVVNSCEPTVVVPYDHPGPYRPRLSIACAQVQGEQRRHAVVRCPFTDERAAQFMRRKARQLPSDAPGIVVLHVSGAVGAMKTWKAVLRHRLRPDQHTRVSAVVLIESGMHGTSTGEAWMHSATVLVNDHAAMPAPAWALAPFNAWSDGEVHALEE
jgi:hypothetical protein